MLSTVKKIGLVGAVCLFSFLLNAQSSYAQPYVCLPTCDTEDIRFFVFAGPDQSTFIDTRYLFGISSPSNSATFEFGIFDGDDSTSQGGPFSDWDQGGSAVITATIYADPTGEGAQDIKIGTWTGDGSAGDNSGNPMPDNDWFNITLDNVEAARSANGNFRYTLVVESDNVDMGAQNQFKIRTDGTMIILPFAPFAFFSLAITVDDLALAFPNLDAGDATDPTCIDQITFFPACNIMDPDCCFFGGTYNGTWKFFIDVPEGEGVFNVWDGDFDYGSSMLVGNACVSDGVDVDIDDPNTPNEVPDFALGTEAVPEGAILDPIPHDNNCFLNFALDPSIFYNVITPTNVSFTNNNPSSSEEWELFNIGLEGDVDFITDEIPGGFWTFMVMGTDFSNLNGLRFDHPVLALDEEGNPVPFDPSSEPIPTMSEWGLVVLSAFVLIASVYYLRRKRVYS